MTDEVFYGLVKKHSAGPLHLVVGRRLVALCDARPDGEAWAVTMRGLVGLSYVREASGLCHGCVAVALGKKKW